MQETRANIKRRRRCHTDLARPPPRLKSVNRGLITSDVPLPRDLEHNEIVTARFWPCLFRFQGAHILSCPLLARYRGTSLIRERSPQDPTVALCLGPYGGPRDSAFSYERGNPVASADGRNRSAASTIAPILQPYRTCPVQIFGHAGTHLALFRALALGLSHREVQIRDSRGARFR